MNYLFPYCTTDQERETLAAVSNLGNMSEAARELGQNIRTVQRKIKRIRERAAAQGVAPEHDMTNAVPDGYNVKGVSTLYGPDGDVRAQWVKSARSVQDGWADMIATLADPFKGIHKPTKGPNNTTGDMLAVYPMGDPHIGLYSWSEETGDDFDADIAERNLCGVIDRLVSVAPKCEEALICNLGDFFHSDSMDNKTWRSGHTLDVDTRWPRVLQIGVRAMRRCIESALKKHRRVSVINEIGNHDDHTAVMLSMVLDAFYHAEPRVSIDLSPSWYHYYRFGGCLIGVTHGDKAKLADLPGIMATDKSADWGETKYRYWYTGHIHHDTLKEFPGCVVESFRTLAAKDAYSASHGYRAGRDMQCIILHRDHGEIERHRVNLEML